jgi:hypothetical protein
MIAILFLLTVESSYFLRLSPGVVSQGLGGSSVTIDEGLSAFHNPACANDMKFNFTLSRWLFSTNYLALGGSYSDYVFGISYLNYGEIHGFDEFGNPTSNFTPYNFCAVLGRRIGSIGVALKGFVEQIADQNLYGMAVCIGFHAKYGRLSIGTKLDNLGKEFSENSAIPYLAAVGLKYDFTQEVAVSAEAKIPQAELNVGFAYTYNKLTLMFGSRYSHPWQDLQGMKLEDFDLTGGILLAIDDYTVGYSVVTGYAATAHQFSVILNP